MLINVILSEAKNLIAKRRIFTKGCQMENNEHIYRSMRFSGTVNIILGVLLIVVGVVSGILLLISGGKLITGKSRIIF